MRKEKEECKIVLENKRQYNKRWNNVPDNRQTKPIERWVIRYPVINFPQKRIFFEFVKIIVQKHINHTPKYSTHKLNDFNHENDSHSEIESHIFRSFLSSFIIEDVFCAKKEEAV